MKSFFFVALIFSAFVSSSAVAQDDDQFERSYVSVRMMCSFDIPESGLIANEWTEMVDANNRFVFNYGTANDVVVHNASGGAETYSQVSEITSGSNDDGDEYQEMEVKSKEGDRVVIMLFDDFLSLIHYYDDGSYLIIQYYLE